MELQSYSPSGYDSVFMDCPGSDDRDERVREMARFFQEVFGVIIFVIPIERTRSQQTRESLKEIAKFLNDRHELSDLRPVRILLSKVDQLDYRGRKKEELLKAILENKELLINDLLKELKELSHFDEFTIFSRQAYEGMILISTETLEDIVRPYSTHSQMSLDEKRALSDCPEGTERKIEGKTHFHNLYHLAEEGKMWDIESLRQWLNGLSPNCVPTSASRGRVFQED